jgi:AbrB family looped-hinge helix DNA binding protein
MKRFGARKIQSNGQVSIPAELVRKLGLSAGDFVLFEERNCGIVITKAELKEVSAV